MKSLKLNYSVSHFEENIKKGPAADPELIDFILEQSYARTVAPEVEKLKQYKGLYYVICLVKISESYLNSQDSRIMFTGRLNTI
jgi:hypothetical protein